MGFETKAEKLFAEMKVIWLDLTPVVAWRNNAMQFCREEIDPSIKGSVGEFAEAARLLLEFDHIWPHRLPTSEELLEAHKAGRLDEKIIELNEAYTGAL